MASLAEQKYGRLATDFVFYASYHHNTVNKVIHVLVSIVPALRDCKTTLPHTTKATPGSPGSQRKSPEGRRGRGGEMG